MPLPDASTPDFQKSHTVHDSNKLPTGTVALVIAATVAGEIVLQMWEGAAVTYGLTVGTHIIPGRFELAKSTGLTATLSPANTVIALCQAGVGGR